jgi:flagellar hook-associated protein 3 FlgL
MRVPTLHTAQRAFEGIEARMSRQAQVQDQLGTGLRVRRPGDDPLAAAQAEMARSRLMRLAQDQRAGLLASGLLSTAESALGQGVNLLQNARELLVAAGNGAYSGAERKALALQLSAMRREMLDLANTGDGAGGRVFSGQGGGASPAAGTDPQWTAPGGVQRIGEGGRYAATVDGEAVFMRVPEGNGVFVTASDPANTGAGWIGAGEVSDATLLTYQRYRIDIGGSPGALTYTVTRVDSGEPAGEPLPLPGGGTLEIDGQRITIGGTPAPGDGFLLAPAQRQSVFQTLDQAIALLEDGTVTPAAFAERLQRVQAGLDRGLEALSVMRSQVGGELRLIDEALASGEGQTLSNEIRRSQLQDLDFARAVSEMQANQTSLEAALKAYATVGRTSLFQML